MVVVPNVLEFVENGVGGSPDFSHGWNSTAYVTKDCRGGEDSVCRGAKTNFTHVSAIPGGNVNFW